MRRYSAVNVTFDVNPGSYVKYFQKLEESYGQNLGIYYGARPFTDYRSSFTHLLTKFSVNKGSEHVLIELYGNTIPSAVFVFPEPSTTVPEKQRQLDAIGFPGRPIKTLVFVDRFGKIDKPGTMYLVVLRGGDELRNRRLLGDPLGVSRTRAGYLEFADLRDDLIPVDMGPGTCTPIVPLRYFDIHGGRIGRIIVDKSVIESGGCFLDDYSFFRNDTSLHVNSKTLIEDILMIHYPPEKLVITPIA